MVMMTERDDEGEGGGMMRRGCQWHMGMQMLIG